MKILELIVSGVPGIQGPLKFPFEPGLNSWKPKGSFSLDSIVELVACLLYPSQGLSTPLGPGRAQTAGMTFEARGTTYRLVREFVSKKLTLSQLEPGSQDRFQEISKESRFITETLTRSARIPSQRIFRGLLVARPGKSRLDVDTSTVSRTLGKEVKPPSVDRQRRLEELKREKAQIKKVHEMEFRQDGLQSRVFQIDDQLKKLDGPRRQLEALKKEYEPYRIFDTPGVLTPQILARLKTFPQAGERRDADLQALEESSQNWQAELLELPDIEYWKEPLAIGGGAAGIIGLLASIFARNVTGALLACLAVMIAGFAVGIFGVLQGLRRIEKITLLKKKIAGLDQEKAGIEKRFEIETGVVRKLFETAKTQDPEELNETLARRETLGAEIKAATVLTESVEKEVPESSLRKERGILMAELESIQKSLQDIPPVSVDPNELERQIRELETALRVSSADAPDPVEFSNGDNDLGRVLQLAGEYVGKSTTEILQSLQQGLAANLAVLTGNAWRAFQISGGRLAGLKDAEGRGRPWSSLPDELKAVSIFTVQFTVWQALSNDQPGPFIVDLLEGAPSDGAMTLCLSAASHLSKRAQVLVLAQ